MSKNACLQEDFYSSVNYRCAQKHTEEQTSLRILLNKFYIAQLYHMSFYKARNCDKMEIHFSTAPIKTYFIYPLFIMPAAQLQAYHPLP